jgi:tRNA uridine 5-carbamoylmethylation protein Kti12
MILFTSGFPYSGKTTYANLLKEELDNQLILHINPKDYYPDDFSSLPEKDQIDIGVTAWEMSLETATKAITSTPDKVLIIFDTCCNKSLHMRPLFMNAKLRGHHVMMVYINATLEDRLSRVSEIDVDKIKGLETKYKESFSTTLPALRSHADSFVVVHNPNTKTEASENLVESARTFADKIKRIRDG